MASGTFYGYESLAADLSQADKAREKLNKAEAYSSWGQLWQEILATFDYHTPRSLAWLMTSYAGCPISQHVLNEDLTTVKSALREFRSQR
jgi:hypothetical protein